MIKPCYLTDQFLIAMPALSDPNFAHTVTYICEHNEQGALGLIVNRPMTLTLGNLLSHLDMDASRSLRASDFLFVGGPVQPEQGLILHQPHGQWDATLRVTDRIGVTTSRDLLRALANNEGPDDALVLLGYAGWGPGQLEREMSENAWLTCPADPEILFATPIEQRWQRASSRIGIDPRLLTTVAGHA